MATAWFFLLGMMLTAYAALDGWDLGIGSLHLLVARTEEERRLNLAVIGPLWNGNEVWLIVAGAALFLSFPRVYASSFSGFYLALMLVLWLLMLRGVSIEFRSQVRNPLWGAFWDGGFFVGSVLLSFLLGVALGNVIQGLPIEASGLFPGTFALLLNPFSALVGTLAVVAFAFHGASYLSVRATGAVYDRARLASRRMAPALGALVIATSGAAYLTRPGLFHNYAVWPVAGLAPAAGAAALAGCVVFSRRPGQELRTLVCSSTLLAALLGSAAISVYPNLLYSTLNPRYSLSIDSAAAPESSLVSGMIAIVPVLALVLAYQGFINRLFWRRLEEGEDSKGY